VKHGWYTAIEALDRFGSAAAGDPVYEAGDALGKLLRTLYLCDYFGNPMFRLEILDLLNQGEAVHSLQRAGYNGVITAKLHGSHDGGARRDLPSPDPTRQHCHGLEHAPAATRRRPGAGEYPDEVLKGIAPIGYKHIKSARDSDLRPLAAWAEPARAPCRRRPKTRFRLKKQGFFVLDRLRQRMNGNALKFLIFVSVTFGMAVTTRPVLLNNYPLALAGVLPSWPAHKRAYSGERRTAFLGVKCTPSERAALPDLIPP
jgi:hypothetical protein